MGKLLYDEKFRHVDYHGTDLRKTFARIRKQQAEERAAREREQETSKIEALSIEAEVQRKVRVLK